MDAIHRRIITKNRTAIINNIANPIDVAEELFEQGIFTENMKQEVAAEKTTIDKMRKVVDLVPRRGEKAFDLFYDALVETENGDIADRLKPDLKEKRLQNASLRKRKSTSVIYQGDELPEVWPDDDAMNSPVVVTSCTTDSHVVREYWHNEHVYTMRKHRRGRCLIIANKNFSGPLKEINGIMTPMLESRLGTEKDEDKLKVLFEQFMFDVNIFTELPVEGKDGIRDVILKESQQEDHENAEAFVLVILSHGTQSGVYGVRGDIIPIDDITTPFDAQHCPFLRHKPKLFFIQACQGEKTDLGGGAGDIEPVRQDFQKINLTDAMREDYPPTSSVANIPTKTDMLVASATHPGFVSLRNINHGSWFIQAIILVFMKYAHKEDIVGLLTFVTNLVGRGRTPVLGELQDVMQASVFSSSLRKKFYFFPGIASEA